MQQRGRGTPIGNRQSNQNVARGRFRVFNGDVEVALVRENARIEELKFRLCPIATGVLLNELLIRECAVRILVERASVAVRGRCILVVVKLLYVLAVIALSS